MNLILPSDPIARGVLVECQARVLMMEDPIGSNRSPELDAMCDTWGIPRGSYWCALLAADIRKKVGADYPPIGTGNDHPAVADYWRRWALATNHWSDSPQLGYAVLYGEHARAPAEHLGVAVATIHPLLYDFEGNTADAGTRGFTRNGELSTFKMVDVDRVIGYVSLTALR